MAAASPAGAEYGRPAKSARRVPASGKPAEPRDLRHLIAVASVLDFSVLQPGRASAETIAQIAADLKLASQYQVRVRQTGNTGTVRNFVTALFGRGAERNRPCHRAVRSRQNRGVILQQVASGRAPHRKSIRSLG